MEPYLMLMEWGHALDFAIIWVLTNTLKWFLD